jgi:superkiller protein 3
VVLILAALLYISGKGFTKLVNIFSGGWSLVSGNAVPLSLEKTDFAAYSMFSIKHLIDFINHQLLLNPLVLFFIILFIVYQFKRLNWREPIFIFLSFASIFTLGLGFTFNHIYGMSKDWDVVAPFVITLLLLCIYLMINKFNIFKTKKWIISIISGVLFLHTIPFILVYSNEESAISRSRALQDERIMPKIGIIVTDMNIAEYYHLKEEYLSVIKTYQNLMERYPYDSRGYLLLTKAYDLDLKNLDKAMEIALLAERRGVFNKKIEYNLGHYYYRKKSYDLAISKWKMALNIDSTYFRAFNYLGVVYAMQNKYDSAIIYLNKSLIYNPDDTGTYQNLGNCYLAKGNYSSAIPYLEKYSLSNSDDYTNYKNLGICYKEIGDINKAIAAWSKYLEIAPGSSEYELINTEIKKMTGK